MQPIQKGEQRGERFERLGSCTKSVQADKIQAGYGKVVPIAYRDQFFLEQRHHIYGVLLRG